MAGTNGTCLVMLPVAASVVRTVIMAFLETSFKADNNSLYWRIGRQLTKTGIAC